MSPRNKEETAGKQRDVSGEDVEEEEGEVGEGGERVGEEVPRTEVPLDSDTGSGDDSRWEPVSSTPGVTNGPERRGTGKDFLLTPFPLVALTSGPVRSRRDDL